MVHSNRSYYPSCLNCTDISSLVLRAHDIAKENMLNPMKLHRKGPLGLLWHIDSGILVSACRCMNMVFVMVNPDAPE